MGVWNSSRQTVQEMTPVLRARSLAAGGKVSAWTPAPMVGTPSPHTRGEQRRLGLLGCTAAPRPTHSHFHVTGFLVVTERAGELGLQGPRHLLLGGRLPLGFAASHAVLG